MAKRKRYKLTKLIRIMRQSRATSDYLVTGGQVEHVCSPYAEVTATQSSETEQAQQVVSGTVYRVIIRRQPREIHMSDWVEVEDRRLDITAIIPDINNEGMYTQLTCRTQQTSTAHETMR